LVRVYGEAGGARWVDGGVLVVAGIHTAIMVNIKARCLLTWKLETIQKSLHGFLVHWSGGSAIVVYTVAICKAA
jgi:hypothetical protein